MSTQPPYFDDLQNLDTSLNNYEPGTSPQTFRYSDPTAATSQTSDVLDLHKLVAAAHSVAEREQHQLIQNLQANSASKRKQKGDVAKSSSKKRRKLDQPRNADHYRSKAHPTDANVTTASRSHKLPSSVLYRPASLQPRRSTRPPMHTLFNSFQMSENKFLQLQSAAKEFMLDPHFPERRSLVGARGSGDGRKVKVELAETVRRFLDEGAGERFFGISTQGTPNSEPMEDDGSFAHPGRQDRSGAVAEADTGPNTPSSYRPNGEIDASVNVARVANSYENPQSTNDAATRTNDEADTRSRSPLLWPRDRDRITDACMPLLRRVVTNEKQRQYALETRQALKDKSAAAQEAPLVVRIYDISASRKGNAAPMTPVTGQIPAQDDDAAESNGQAQWDMILGLLGTEASSKTIQIQTADGLMRVHDSESCRGAVEQILMAPWLDRTLRIIVSDSVDADRGAEAAA